MAQLVPIADRAAWIAAAAAGEYRVSTRGVTLDEQGFIHCSERHQLREVAERFYADADDLVVLVIDSTLVTAPIRYEASAPDPEPYPHIYGPLPTEAVTEVLTVRRDQAGRFILPG